jgi:hypothetical protein
MDNYQTQITNKKPRKIKNLQGEQYFQTKCGERGIRTPGPVTVNGFQDRRIRPLCHLSAAKVHDHHFHPKKKWIYFYHIAPNPYSHCITAQSGSFNADHLALIHR